MKAVILCGGRGTRLGQHGVTVPKALIEIGGRPIIWHLMQHYAGFGITDFVLCLGYLGNEIIRYVEALDHPWKIDCVDTGADTNTGGRLLRVSDRLVGNGTFCTTYGDGLANIDIGDLVSFHRQHGSLATVTAVHPTSTFGIMTLDNGDVVREFREKPVLPDWVNGGFFVFEEAVLDLIHDDEVLEREPFERLVAQRAMQAYRHHGFWKCMDTFKDSLEFEQLWHSGRPWTVPAKQP